MLLSIILLFQLVQLVSTNVEMETVSLRDSFVMELDIAVSLKMKVAVQIVSIVYINSFDQYDLLRMLKDGWIDEYLHFWSYSSLSKGCYCIARCIFY